MLPRGSRLLRRLRGRLRPRQRRCLGHHLRLKIKYAPPKNMKNALNINDERPYIRRF